MPNALTVIVFSEWAQQSEPCGGMRGSRRIALIAVFAAITTALDSMVTPGFSSGVWYGWVFLMSPVNGMILGPWDGFLATLISVLVGHTLVLRDSVYEYVFTIGAPLGALMAGLVFRGERRWTLAYFAVFLGLYYLNPVGRSLPVWGMWDVYVAFTVLLVITVLEKRMDGKLIATTRTAAALGALMGLEADILYRIFVLVPLGGYELFYGLTPELLVMIWSVSAPLITPLKVGTSLLISTLLVPSILKITEASFNA
jgi:hypothetical protein